MPQDKQTTDEMITQRQLYEKMIETLLLPHLENGFPTKFCGEELCLISCERKPIKLQWKKQLE